MKIYKSIYDKSVNFVADNMQESRFVQRTDDYFIVYLSSQNGCNKACRFCHLTQTGQLEFNHANLEEYLTQAQYPLDHYKFLLQQGQIPSKKVNFNFMARGEVFSNPMILENPDLLMEKLKEKVAVLNLDSKFNFSTIGPMEIKEKEFSEIFKSIPQDVMIYYSLYSVNAQFRKKWLPKALPVDNMLEKLRNWQDLGGEIALHWAFIENQNDSPEDIEQILEKLNQYSIKAKFNLVRYNPYSIAQGAEPSNEIIERNFNLIAQYLDNPSSRIVPRVGFDVKASCGMFV